MASKLQPMAFDPLLNQSTTLTSGTVGRPTDNEIDKTGSDGPPGHFNSPSLANEEIAPGELSHLNGPSTTTESDANAFTREQKAGSSPESVTSGLSDDPDPFVKNLKVLCDSGNEEFARGTFDTASTRNWASEEYVSKRLKMAIEELPHENTKCYQFDGAEVMPVGQVTLTWYFANGRKSYKCTFLVYGGESQTFDVLIGSKTIHGEAILTWNVEFVWVLKKWIMRKNKDKDKDKRKPKNASETPPEEVDQETERRRKEINDLLRRQRLQGNQSLSQPQNQMSTSSVLRPIWEMESVSQNTIMTEDNDTILPISKSAFSYDNEPKHSASGTVWGAEASARRPSTTMTVVQQHYDSPQKTNSETTSISSTAEMMQGRSVSTFSVTGAAPSSIPPAIKPIEPAHCSLSVMSLAPGIDIRPMNTTQSTTARQLPRDTQTQATELPQNKLKPGNVREEGQMQSTREIHYHEKDTGANNGQRMVTNTNSNTMETNHGTTENTETRDGRGINETKGHEGERNDDRYWGLPSPKDRPAAAGTRQTAVQDVITRPATPPSNCTRKDSQELIPQFSGMPIVPGNDPIAANRTVEGNLDVDKGKEKTIVLVN